MRAYGIVHTTFWTSETTHGLTDDGKLLSLYLLTGPHTTALGCFRIPDGYVMGDLQWSIERVKKGFTELLVKGFSERCETTNWVLIRTYLKWNPPENPNQRKALRKLAEQIPDNASIKNAIEALINQHCGPSQQLELISEPKANIRTVSEQFQNPIPNQEQEQKQNQNQNQNQIQNESCGERQAPPHVSPLVSRLPLIDGSIHHVRESDVEKWSGQYPAINVRTELGKMAGWLDGNPKNRKTTRGVMAFIHRWLARAQDDAPRVGGSGNGTQSLSASERMRRKVKA